MIISPGYFNEVGENVENNIVPNNVPNNVSDFVSDYFSKLEEEQENIIKCILTDCYKELDLKVCTAIILSQKKNDEENKDNNFIKSLIISSLMDKESLILKQMPEHIIDKIASKQSKEICNYFKNHSVT